MTGAVLYLRYMFGFSRPSFRYDSTLRRTQASPASWRRDGNTFVFGPDYVAAVLAQEQRFAKDFSAERAADAEWIGGVSAAMLRKDFPEAIREYERASEPRFPLK